MASNLETLKLKRHGKHVYHCLTSIKNLSKNLPKTRKPEDEFKIVELLQTADNLMKEIKQVVLGLITPETNAYKKLQKSLEAKINTNYEELNKKYKTVLEKNKSLEYKLENNEKKFKNTQNELINAQNQVEDFETTLNDCLKQKEKYCRKNRELFQNLAELHVTNLRNLKVKEKHIEELKVQIYTCKKMLQDERNMVEKLSKKILDRNKNYCAKFQAPSLPEALKEEDDLITPGASNNNVIANGTNLLQ